MITYKSRAKIFKEAQQRSYNKAKEFWNHFKFPAKFHVGIKEVLSGLSESSWGNGQRRNSKIHIIVDEDINIGRLKRSTGEFLCSQQSRVANWSGQNDEQLYYYYEGEKYVPAINCKECLKKSERFQNQ